VACTFLALELSESFKPIQPEESIVNVCQLINKFQGTEVFKTRYFKKYLTVGFFYGSLMIQLRLLIIEYSLWLYIHMHIHTHCMIHTVWRIYNLTFCKECDLTHQNHVDIKFSTRYIQQTSGPKKRKFDNLMEFFCNTRRGINKGVWAAENPTFRMLLTTICLADSNN
jgi:hypothetical protein